MQPPSHLALDHSFDQPAALLSSLRDISFACPSCRGSLRVSHSKEAYRCQSCEKEYSLHDGIPDFRIFADPFLSFQEDYERTEIVLDALERYELKELLEYYWSFSDITPKDLRPKFVRSALLGEQRAQRILSSLEDETFAATTRARRVLEIGSGTGNFLALAVERYDQVIGIDIAMRWLHVSRRRFMDKGLPIPPLACCCAEHLPFPDRSFDVVVTASTLEFVRDPDKMLSECARVLKDDGLLYINTANRYSVAKDSYAYLWGVGFLPRAYQARYVRWRRGASYENIRPLSFRQLSRIAKKNFATKEFALPDVDTAVLREFSPLTRLQVRVYKSLQKLPLFNLILKRAGPGWDIVLRK